MSEAKPALRGVLGRGPAFWGVSVLVSTCVFLALVFSGAVEGKGTVWALTMVPVALTFVMFLAAYRSAQAPSGNCVAQSSAQQTYIKRTVLFTSLYLIAFALLILADRELDISRPLKFGLALLPGLAICGVFWAIGRLIVEEKDEFLRMLVVRQSLIATGFALSLASVWGFLESAELVIHIDAYYWAVAWFLGLAVGAVFNRIQYGTWGAV